MNRQSVTLMIALSLFLGGVGLPVPENPVLLGGGYAIYKGLSHPLKSLILWYLAILCGDLFLFAVAYLFFSGFRVRGMLMRYAGRKRIERYQTAFSRWGGWLLFLSRFTFGVRAAAYVAAGAAHYPWLRFIAIDASSVAVQILLFVGIGYYAGEQVKWARASSEKIALTLGVLALITILVTWLSSTAIKRLFGIADDTNGADSD